MTVTIKKFSSIVGIEPDVFDRIFLAFEELISEARRTLEAARPCLLAAFAAIQSIEQLPPIRGYEELLTAKGNNRVFARFFAWNLLRLGKELTQERRAERKLSSAIYALASAASASILVISRRARSIDAAFDDGVPMSSFRAALVEADLSESEDSFRDLARLAAARDVTACERLLEACRELKPHVPDPRGRIPSDASATHELLLHLLKRAYTYDAVNDCYNDPATRATRIAMNVDNFRPQSAHRRLRGRAMGRGQRWRQLS